MLTSYHYHCYDTYQGKPPASSREVDSVTDADDIESDFESWLTVFYFGKDFESKVATKKAKRVVGDLITSGVSLKMLLQEFRYKMFKKPSNYLDHFMKLNYSLLGAEV